MKPGTVCAKSKVLCQTYLVAARHDLHPSLTPAQAVLGASGFKVRYTMDSVMEAGVEEDMTTPPWMQCSSSL